VADLFLGCKQTGKAVPFYLHTSKRLNTENLNMA